MSARSTVIAGVGMHPWGKWGRPFVQYGVHAARAALEDAGVPWTDVDLVVGGETVRNGYAGYVAGSTFAQALGWNGARIATSYAACATGAQALDTARARILAGMSEVALVVGADTTPKGFLAPNAGERWAATHKTASIFSVNQDLQEPTLTAVTYTKNLGSDSRFELTFNEPIAAFNGTTAGRLDSSITSSSVLDAITFGATDRSGGLKNLNLRGGSNASLTYDPRSSTLFGASSGDIEKEFKLDKNAFAAGGRSSLTAGADNGKMYVEVDPRNPKTLFIYVFNKANIFDTKITDLKVRAEGVGDPAGNTIKSAAADQNQPTGSI